MGASELKNDVTKDRRITDGSSATEKGEWCINYGEYIHKNLP